jgi:6-phosphogluconolactonase
MHLIVEDSVELVAKRAADWIAAAVADDVAERGRAVVALSGGKTPWLAFADLARRNLPWGAVHLAQVDERVVPITDERRNAMLMRQIFIDRGLVPASQLHMMPVEDGDIVQAADAYSDELAQLCGGRLWFDLVQLGLGADGHTASLVPHDPALNEREHNVAVTGEYFGTRRMTLTYPAINRARRILWLVTGAEKSAVLANLLARGGATSDVAPMPALGVSRERATVIADRAATQDLPEAATA